MTAEHAGHRLFIRYSYAGHSLRTPATRWPYALIRYIEMYDTLAIGQTYALYTFITLCIQYVYIQLFPPVRFFAGKLDEFQPIGNLQFISHTSAYADAMCQSVTGP